MTTVHLPRPRKRVLILGTGRLAKEFCRVLLSRQGRAFEVVGLLDKEPSRVGEPLVNPGIIGTFDQLFEIVERSGSSHSPLGRGQAEGTRKSL